MKKHICVLLALLVTYPAFGKNLLCWNIYSKLSSRPILSAQIVNENKLKNVYVEDMIYMGSKLNPSLIGPVLGREVIKDPIFQGKREYRLKHKSRLILPSKINSESLKQNFNSKSLRKNNGLFILAELGSGGYLKSEKIVRLFCEIKEDK